MTDTSRRNFFKTFLAAGAALTVSGTAARPCRAEAGPAAIKGVCLYVPSLGKASDFVDFMNSNAPGAWTVHPLQGSLTDNYFTVRSLYDNAKENANTFVGVVDPATFAIVHEAIVDSSGSFHYINYEESSRITFSVQL